MGELTKLIRNKLKIRGYDVSPKEEFYINKNKKISFKSDIVISLDKRTIFIEVEESQHHPDTNVSKYWYSIESNEIKESPILLIQIFGKLFYKDNYKSRVELSKFIAKKIKKEYPWFGYEFISLKEGYELGKSNEEISDDCVNKIIEMLKEAKNELG